MAASNLVTHFGSCHCGQVRFKVTAPSTVVVFDCKYVQFTITCKRQCLTDLKYTRYCHSCSVCTKKQNRHFIVPATSFTLLQGKDQLTTYTFGTHQAKHQVSKLSINWALFANNYTLTLSTHLPHTSLQFCKICGVQCFYSPRSNPDGIGKPEQIFKFTILTFKTKFHISHLSKGIMPHCIDEGTIENVTIKTFDGQNWEESMEKFPQIKKFSQQQ